VTFYFKYFKIDYKHICELFITHLFCIRS